MNVTGTIPWLPPPLNRWKWLTEPIRAERLAAWRMGVGVVLLVDLLLFHLPYFRWFYGPNSLAGPGVFAERFAVPHWNWSVLNWLPIEWGPRTCFAIWVAAATLIIAGWQTRWAALAAWVLSISFYNTNFYLHNSGDRIRHFVLLLLVLAPGDAVWSLRKRTNREPLFVAAWPARLMFLQMCVMYFMNGYYKMQGRIWWDGSVMHYVCHDYAWARWSAVAAPVWVMKILSWGALAWETGFPLWVLLKRTRTIALLLGVLFHVITFFHLEIAAFPLYALCLYLPLAPWERRSAKPQAA